MMKNYVSKYKIMWKKLLTLKNQEMRFLEYGKSNFIEIKGLKKYLILVEEIFINSSEILPVPYDIS